MTFKIYTLGCKVNAYESMVMEELLLKNGYQKSDNPDICIINTCTVTNTADSKSAKMIRKIKRENEKALIIATGCLIQNKKDIAKELGVDIAIGNKNKSQILKYIEEYKQKQIIDVYDLNEENFETMKLNNFNKTRAFIKIEDGCSNFCSYCIIPYVRGPVRSKPYKEVIEEAKNLVLSGHKEIVLTGIHTGHYHDKNCDFSDLLTYLVKIKGLERLRISSVEITELNDKFLKVLKENPILVDHMHIPLQAGSDEILKKMNRKYDKKYFIDRINKIRQIRPNISITTDVITGFPSETEKLFEEGIETIKKIKFTKLHVFPYSNRKGTVADKMEGQIPNEVKKERVKILQELSIDLEKEYMEQFLNKDVVFLSEITKDNYVIGHTDNYLLVKVYNNKIPLNELQEVKIKEVNYPYVIGFIK